MRLKRIRLLHHVFLMFTVFFLISISPFLGAFLQNHSHNRISCQGTINDGNHSYNGTSPQTTVNDEILKLPAHTRYDFDEVKLGGYWNVVSGSWRILNGSLDGFSGSEGLIYTRDMMWNDCMLTAKVKIAADSPKAEAAFCVCFVDSGNFYWAGLGCWGHRVSISRTVDSVPEELVFSGDSTDIVKDVWYNLSIEVSGDAISLYVNDVLELVMNDSTIASGVIGVRTWDSHVLVDHVTVSGVPSITTPSPPIGIQCGFVTQRSSYNAWTDDLLDEIKTAGFGSILIEHWMGKEQRRDGTYDETRLANGKKLFDKVKAAGLTPIIDLRVALYPDMRNYDNGYTTWPDGNPHADWVVLTETGKERFIDCWRKLIQTYNPSIISMWHFPGHNGGFGNARDAYMTTWGPEVVRRIRAFYDGEIIFTLPYQGSRESAGSKSYWFSYYDPLPGDCDVIYGAGHMLYWNVVSNPSKDWDYDYAQLEKDFEGIKKYVSLGKRVCSIEFGGLEYTVGSKPRQSRLDYLDAVCKKMAFYNAPWIYHVCRPQGRYAGGDNIIESLNTQAIQPDIFDVLRKNIVS
jgi:hypothetical protein